MQCGREEHKLVVVDLGFVEDDLHARSATFTISHLNWVVINSFSRTKPHTTFLRVEFPCPILVPMTSNALTKWIFQVLQVENETQYIKSSPSFPTPTIHRPPKSHRSLHLPYIVFPLLKQCSEVAKLKIPLSLK